MYSNNSNHRERYRYSNNNNNNGVGTSSGSNNNSPHSNTSQYTNGIRKSDSPSRKRRRISRLPNQTPPVVVWDQRRPQRHQPQVKNIFFSIIFEVRKFLFFYFSSKIKINLLIKINTITDLLLHQII